MNSTVSYSANRFAEIAGLLQDAATWAKVDERLDAHFASYVCVILSGAIEDIVEKMFASRMSVLGDSEASSYVVKVIGERFRNPDWPAINGLLGEFSDEYKMSWRTKFPPNGQLHGCLESINNIKNALAHTGSNSLHVTLKDAQYYLNNAIEAMQHLESIVLPPNR